MLMKLTPGWSSDSTFSFRDPDYVLVWLEADGGREDWGDEWQQKEDEDFKIHSKLQFDTLSWNVDFQIDVWNCFPEPSIPSFYTPQLIMVGAFVYFITKAFDKHRLKTC